MSEEILINVTAMETRVAIIENGILQDVYIERSRHKGYVGNIFNGKVVRVLPGMQAAFVDIGLQRASFIHASDISVLDNNGMENRDLKTEDIRQLVTEGQKLIVQVVKDPLGTKGARLTTHLSISSRYLVYMPYTGHIGISQRIENEAERDRLRGLVESAVQYPELANMRGGFIVRTAAEGIGNEEIKKDITYLRRLWAVLEERMQTNTTPLVVYEDLPLFLRTMRDMMRPQIERVRIDNSETFDHTCQFVDNFVPQVRDKLEKYSGERPLFDLYGTEDEIKKALGRKVMLKSGGHLVIDQTEAMSTVDVNTGTFVGQRNLEETIYKTNLEAATSLARQLRLRNLGGIIIIDFIDMRDTEHQRQVLRALEKALDRDHAKTSISGVSDLGLVEITRKRTRESLEHVLTVDCPACQGRGTMKSPETVCYEIFREILREAQAYENDAYLVLASQAVVDRLLDEESSYLADLEESIGKNIKFQVETMYSHEQFDVILL